MIDPSECKTTAERGSWLRAEAESMEKGLPPQHANEWCGKRVMAATARNIAARMEANVGQEASSG